MSKYIEDQVDIIKYYKLIETINGRYMFDLDYTARRFIEKGYAEKYSEIWHEGIDKGDLINKLFYDNSPETSKETKE